MLIVDSVFSRLDREAWLVTARDGMRRGGLIATFVNNAGIVADMPRVLVGITHTHFTCELIKASRAFGLHLLGTANIDWVWNFGLTKGRERDKLAGLSVSTAVTGAPIAAGALAGLDCRVEAAFDIGERMLFVAEVVAVGPAIEGEPLTMKTILQRANPEQKAELKRQYLEDAARDADVIRAWREKKGADG